MPIKQARCARIGFGPYSSRLVLGSSGHKKGLPRPVHPRGCGFRCSKVTDLSGHRRCWSGRQAKHERSGIIDRVSQAFQCSSWLFHCFFGPLWATELPQKDCWRNAHASKIPHWASILQYISRSCMWHKRPKATKLPYLSTWGKFRFK